MSVRKCPVAPALGASTGRSLAPLLRWPARPRVRRGGLGGPAPPTPRRGYASAPVSDLPALVAGFADAAAAYERGRPEYPPAIVERLVAELGVRSPSARVLDLGAGTGKLARGLVAAGADVVAV